MTLQQLSYLVTVAECGNITDAAERLFISQPSLSTAIHNLEKEMGVTARSFWRSRGSCWSRPTSCRSISARERSANPNSACRASTIPSRSTPLSMSCSSSTPTVTALSCAKRRPARSSTMWPRGGASLASCICASRMKPCSPSCCAGTSWRSRSCLPPHRTFSSTKTIRLRRRRASRSKS